MESVKFFKRFTDSQEIGRDITDTQLTVFYDNGKDVGQWRQDRSTTVGMGSILAADDAEMARYWFTRLTPASRAQARQTPLSGVPTEYRR